MHNVAVVAVATTAAAVVVGVLCSLCMVVVVVVAVLPKSGSCSAAFLFLQQLLAGRLALSLRPSLSAGRVSVVNAARG